MAFFFHPQKKLAAPLENQRKRNGMLLVIKERNLTEKEWVRVVWGGW